MRELVTGSLTNLAYFATGQLFITDSDFVFDAVAAPVAIDIPLFYGMRNIRFNLLRR